MKFISQILIILTIALSLSACLYKQDIQQGNEITAEMVDRLSVGMTKRQVERSIGLPLISDPFNKDRWDYFYSLKEGRSGKVQRESASLFFEGDKLVNIQSSFDLSQKKASVKAQNQAASQALEKQENKDKTARRKVKEENPWWKFW